jgi:Mg2+ and Co2+ transporter CorA
MKISNPYITSFSGLSGIIGSRESLTEAGTIGRLTVLGMVFLPLSHVSSLFSMSDNYLPGAKSFGIYWAISLPMVLFVLLIPYFMIQTRRWRRRRQEKTQISEYRWWENKT